MNFSIKIGINEKRAKQIIAFFQKDYPLIHQLIKHSFLSEESKIVYTNLYFDKLKRLNYRLLTTKN